MKMYVNCTSTQAAELRRSPFGFTMKFQSWAGHRNGMGLFEMEAPSNWIVQPSGSVNKSNDPAPTIMVGKADDSYGCGPQAHFRLVGRHWKEGPSSLECSAIHKGEDWEPIVVEGEINSVADLLAAHKLANEPTSGPKQ